MKLVLTNKGDGKEIIVDSDHIKLLEASSDADGIGSHICIESNLNRMVKESPAAIAKVMGVVAVKDVPADMSLASIARKR